MRDHYDKAVARHLAEYVHDLNACCGVERARRLVGKQYVGVVDESARYCHALHLTARHLIGLLAELIAQPHFVQRFLCTIPALRA